MSSLLDKRATNERNRGVVEANASLTNLDRYQVQNFSLLSFDRVGSLMKPVTLVQGAARLKSPAGTNPPKMNSPWTPFL